MLLFYMSFIDNDSDKSKFEIIYYEYRERMYFAAYDVLNNKEDSEDAVHNAFIGIANNMNAIDEPLSSRTLSYVLKAAKNAAINIYNKNRKTEKTEYNDSLLISDEDFIDRMIVENDYNRVVQMISELKDTYRIPLYYYFVCDMKIKEIASLTGLSVSAVKVRIHRGKKELLNKMGEDNDQ